MSVDIKYLARRGTEADIDAFLYDNPDIRWEVDEKDNSLLDYLIQYGRYDILDLVMDYEPPEWYIENALDFVKERIRLDFAIKNSPSRRSNPDVYKHFSEEIDDLYDVKEYLESCL